MGTAYVNSKVVVVANSGIQDGQKYGAVTVGCYSTRGAYVAVHDSAGNPLWIRTVDGRLNAVGADHSGHIYIAGLGTKFCGGQSADYIDGSADRAVLACYDQNGNLIWVRKEPNSANATWGNDLAVDKSGNIFMSVTDNTGNYSALNSFYVVKYNANGNRLWATPLTSYGIIKSICVDDLGNCYIAGVNHSPISMGPFQLQKSEGFFLAKLDGDGNVLWAKSDGDKFVPRDLVYSTTGHLFVAGGGSGHNAFGTNTLAPIPTRGYDVLLKYDSLGISAWAIHLGGMDGRTLAALPDGGCFYSGDFGSSDPFVCSSPATTAQTEKSHDIFYARINQHGEVQWLGFPNGSYPESTSATAAAYGSGGYYLGGSFDGTLSLGGLSANSGSLHGYSFLINLSEFSQVTSTGSLTESWLGVFPNPASMTINVLLTSKGSQPCRVAIQSTSGELLANQEVPTGTDHTELDVSSLPRGCYLLDVTR